MAKQDNYKKRCIKLFLILSVVILLTIISSNLYKNYVTNKINKSYIAKHVSNVQYNEINNAMTELSSDAFLYIGYTGNSEIYSFEVKLKKVLKEKELSDNLIYMNVTDLMEESDYINKINTTLGLENQLKINKLPAIIYFKDSKIVEVIDSKNQLLNTSLFVQLLEKYEININGQ